MKTARDPCTAFWPAHHSTVYFLECRDLAGNVHVKVGKAQSPAERVSTLQTGLPLPITRLRYVGMRSARQALQIEKELHRYLAEWASTGEWFLFPAGDSRASDHYAYGVSGQLDCLLCRGAWKYEEIDWPAYKAAKAEKRDEYIKAGGPGRKLWRQHGMSMRVSQ